MKHTILVCIVLLVAVFEFSAPFGIFDRPVKPRCTTDAEKGTCPINWHPVCGTDRVTYKNECELCHANLSRERPIKIKSRGKC